MSSRALKSLAFEINVPDRRLRAHLRSSCRAHAGGCARRGRAYAILHTRKLLLPLCRGLMPALCVVLHELQTSFSGDSWYLCLRA
jgi:hypothetical protein